MRIPDISKQYLFTTVSLFIFILIVSLELPGASVSRETEKARRFMRKKEYARALKIYLAAQKNDPGVAANYYEGAAALSHLYRYREAVASITRAIELGVRHGHFSYTSESTPYERLGNYNREIGLFPEALAAFRKARETIEGTLKKSIQTNNLKQIERGIIYLTHIMRREIHVHNLWGQLKLIRRDFPEYYKRLMEVEDLVKKYKFPETSKGAAYRIRQTWDNYHIGWFNVLWAEGQFTEARQHLERISETPDKRTTHATALRLLKIRESLGKIRPAHNLKIAVLLITKFDLPVRRGDRVLRVKREMGRGKLDGALHRLRYVKRYYETFSRGTVTMTFYPVVVQTPVTVWSGRIPEVSSSTGVREFIKNKAAKYDLVVKVWDVPIASAFGGGRGVLIKALHTHGIYVHEFFHIIEGLYHISPTHGYGVKERKSYPGWRGTTLDQYDYFDWHFQTTVKSMGYDKFNL